MNEPADSAVGTEAAPRKGTRLPKIGCLIGLLGLIGGPLFLAVARGLGDGSGRLTGGQRLLLLMTDGARLLVFVGLAVFLIGIVRHMKERRQKSAQPGS